MLDSVASGHIAPIALAGMSQRVMMLADIDRAVRATALPDPVRVAAVLAPYLTDPDLLNGVACPCNAARYCRHLLGEGDGYCVLAITWRPGQMSPVHAHKAWCALGVHRGWLVESFFDTTGGAARPTGCLPRGIGAISHAAADGAAIHRIANVGVADALSIHVYGASYDRLGADVNVVLAD